jgi:hypothetical protein
MEILSKSKNTIQGRCPMVKRKLELRNNHPSDISEAAGVPFNRSGQGRDEWRIETNRNNRNLLVLGAINVVRSGPLFAQYEGRHVAFLSSIR